MCEGRASLQVLCPERRISASPSSPVTSLSCVFEVCAPADMQRPWAPARSVARHSLTSLVLCVFLSLEHAVMGAVLETVNSDVCVKSTLLI